MNYSFDEKGEPVEADAIEDVCFVGMQQTESYEYEVLLNYDYLQRVVRNPQYIRLCEEIEFDDTGFACHPVFDDVDDDVETFEKIENEFGLLTVVDPSVVIEERYSPEMFSQLPVFNKPPFACRLLFNTIKEKDQDVSNPIHDRHYLILSIDRLATIDIIKRSIEEYLEAYSKFMPGDLAGKEASVKEQSARDSCRFIKAVEENRITARINILAYKRDIFVELTKYITPQSGRIHLEKRDVYYKIWDKRKDRKSFSEIAAKFNLKKEQGRKQFRKAFELIIGREYDKSLWKELVLNHLIKKAKNSSGEEQIRAYKELGKFEDGKQQYKLLREKAGNEKEQEKKLFIKENIQSESLLDDPEVALLLEDIKRICADCPDTECKAKEGSASTIEDISNLECLKIYDFLTSK